MIAKDLIITKKTTKITIRGEQKGQAKEETTFSDLTSSIP